jgi:hypothetical protein
MTRNERLIRRRRDSLKLNSFLPSCARRHLPSFVQFLPWLIAGVFFFAFQPAQARPGSNANDPTLRAAIEQAVAIAHPTAADQPALKILSRDDLDDGMSKISAKAGDVSFYEADAPSPALGGDHSVWAVVSHDSPLGPFGLYDFESSDGLKQSSQEFNRLVSQLALLVPNEKATDVARLFLACCVLDEPGEVVANEDTLHHGVERDYMQIYGTDVYRALAAFGDWWQGYAASGYAFPQAQTTSGGSCHITLERIVLKFGMHPQLQQYDLEIAPDGSVHSVTVVTIFPREDTWVSYDPRPVTPPSPVDRMKALIKH